MATSRQYKEPFLGQNISPSERGAYFCVVTGIVGRCGPCAIEAASRRGTARRTCPTTPVAGESGNHSSENAVSSAPPSQRHMYQRASHVSGGSCPLPTSARGKSRAFPSMSTHAVAHFLRNASGLHRQSTCLRVLRCAAMSNTPALAYGGDETVRGHPARRAPPALLAAPQRARPFGAICLQLRHPARPPITSRCAPPANRLSRGIVASR